MTDVLKPRNTEDVRALVEWAAGEEMPLEIIGAGTKRGLGRPVVAERHVDLSGLAGVTLYEPEELILSARAGTPLAEIEALLAGNRQQLAFEPPDLGPLYGKKAGLGTLGGCIACNLSGSSRIKAGAARDHFLGFEAVSGRGETFKSGGRVVKNVTGYDLCKLIAGSYGTLGVMTDVIVKVLPRPEKTRTVLVLGLDDETAVRAMSAALNSEHEVSAAAHMPASVAVNTSVAYVRDAGTSITAVRVEGFPGSVTHRCDALRALLIRFGTVEELHSMNSAKLWRELANATPFVAPDDRAVWRISTPPASAAALAADIRKECAADVFFDWGGGLLWLATVGKGDAGTHVIRQSLGRVGGHATLMRAPSWVRATVPVFEPLPSGVAALSARVKRSFDPRHILNPGRMYPEVAPRESEAAGTDQADR